MTVSSVISFVLILQLFVNLSQSPWLVSPRTELSSQSTTCCVEKHVRQDNCCPQPWEQPGGAQDSPGHLVRVYSSLPLCAITILPFSLCAMTPERWGSTVQREKRVSSGSSSSASSGPVPQTFAGFSENVQKEP